MAAGGPDVQGRRVIAELLVDQSGVVSRGQLVAAGLRPHDIARMVRRKDLVQVHRGVYVDHTGQLTWLQRAWAAVMLCWPAALSHGSAMRAHEGPGRRVTADDGSDQDLHVAVDRDRRAPRVPAGIVVHRMIRLEDRVQWHLGPPRVRYEEAALDVAAAARSDFEALGHLSRAIQSRRTSAARLHQALAARARIPRRAWLDAVLDDVAGGVCSVLEHGYLTRVERPHALSGARRQVRDRLGAGVVYRDVVYADGDIVELDGRLFHDTTQQRDSDFQRDLEAAAFGRRTVRLSYGQVFERPCETAALVATALGMTATRCGPSCAVRDG